MASAERKRRDRRVLCHKGEQLARLTERQDRGLRGLHFESVSSITGGGGCGSGCRLHDGRRCRDRAGGDLARSDVRNRYRRYGPDKLR